jgi:hypothetical protein
MKPKRTKATTPTSSPEMSGGDRDLLISAYKTGLIAGWRQDPERGYCVALGNQPDEYVEAAKLSSYLEKLHSTAA